MPEQPLSQMMAVLDAWRSLYSEIQAQTIATFLHIAADPGITLTKLQERLGIAQSSTSRNVAYLSDWYRYQVAGLGLVRTEVNPQNRREKSCHLTAKGERFLKTLYKLQESE